MKLLKTGIFFEFASPVGYKNTASVRIATWQPVFLARQQ